MRGTHIRLAIMATFTLSTSAQAGIQSGKTADGCSYKIINGQYLTSCPGRPSAEPTLVAQQAAPNPPSNYNASRPVGSYGEVPMRHNPSAPTPIVQPSRANPAPAPAYVSSIERDDGQELESVNDERRERLRNRLLDKTYAGLLIGTNNMKESNTGSSVGFGLNIGTNISDHFGVELGYSYSKQSLRLGLASRGANADLGLPGSPTSDAELSSHLLSSEFQGYLTDPLKRLRPYLGVGLGWRSASLNENRLNSASDPYGYASSSGGGSLHQSAIGGLASAGSKLRISKAFHLGVAFRYFFPLFRQDARLEQPANLGNGTADQPLPSNQSKLSQADDSLTGSSQYQVLGGLQYAF